MDKVLAESSIIPLGSPVADQAEILSLRGQAYALKGKAELAEQELQKALKIKSDSNQAHVGMAILHANKNDLVNAKKELELATKADPNAPEAWSILGDLELRQGKLTEAEKAFSQAIKARKVVSLELARRALTRIQLKKFNEAKADIDLLNQEGLKDHPYVSYVTGIAYFSEFKFAEAQTAFETSYAKDPTFPPTQLYLATTHLRLGHLEQALSIAKKLNSQIPNSRNAIQLLSAIQIGRTEYSNARDLLLATHKKSPNDVSTLNMLANLSLLEGNASQALEYSLKALSIDPKSQQAKDLMLTAKLLAGEKLDDSNISLNTNDAYSRDLLIALSNYKQGKLTDSLSQANKLHERFPDKIDPLNLIAASYLALGQWDKAKPKLEQVLKLKPDDPATVRNLAKIEAKIGDPKRAKDLLQGLIKKQPKDTEAALILAEAMNKNEEREASLQLLELTAKNNPNDLSVSTRLAADYLRDGQANKVLEITKNLTEEQLQQPTLLELRGKAFMLSGNAIAARNAFDKLVKRFPNSAPAHFYLADSLTSTSEFERARLALEQSIKLDPKFLPARIGEIKFMVHKNKIIEAKAALVKLRTDFGNHFEVQGLEGWFALGTGDYAGAEKILSAVIKQKPDQELLILLTRSQWLQKKPGLAIKTLQNWLKLHPNDVVVLLSLAEAYLNSNEKESAAATYAQILKLYPDHIQALNDYAWLSQEKDLKQAISYAQRAYQLAPNNAIVMDTLGMLTLKAGDLTGAGNLLQKAAARAPDTLQIQLHWEVFDPEKRFTEARQTIETVIKRHPELRPPKRHRYFSFLYQYRNKTHENFSSV